jgi:hypothetical protein
MQFLDIFQFRFEVGRRPNGPTAKKARQMKSTVKCVLFIFFYFKGVVNKEFVIAGQTVNFAQYCKVLW